MLLLDEAIQTLVATQANIKKLKLEQEKNVKDRVNHLLPMGFGEKLIYQFAPSEARQEE